MCSTHFFITSLYDLFSVFSLFQFTYTLTHNGTYVNILHRFFVGSTFALFEWDTRVYGVPVPDANSAVVVVTASHLDIPTAPVCVCLSFLFSAVFGNDALRYWIHATLPLACSPRHPSNCTGSRCFQFDNFHVCGTSAALCGYNVCRFGCKWNSNFLFRIHSRCNISILRWKYVESVSMLLLVSASYLKSE